MTSNFLKALAALAPACMLLAGSVFLFRSQRSLWLLLQLVGAGCLVLVVLTHVAEAIHVFPQMQRGRELRY